MFSIAFMENGFYCTPTINFFSYFIGFGFYKKKNAGALRFNLI